MQKGVEKRETANPLRSKPIQKKILSNKDLMVLAEHFDPSLREQSPEVRALLKKADLLEKLEINPFLVQNEIISLVVALENSRLN